MRINNKAQRIISAIQSIDSLNDEKNTLRNVLDFIFPVMIASKKNLKSYQQIYWNHKELRSDPDFIKAYESSLNAYELCKKQYSRICYSLKLNKLTIKERQREISKFNRVD